MRRLLSGERRKNRAIPRFALHLEAKFNRLASTFHQFIERLRLSVTTSDVLPSLWRGLIILPYPIRVGIQTRRSRTIGDRHNVSQRPSTRDHIWSFDPFN